MGIAKGDRVALMHRNAPEFFYTWFALSFLGAITVPINPVFTETEIAYILGHSGAKALIIEDEFLATLAKVPQAEMPEMKQVIVSGGQAPAGTSPFAQLLEGEGKDPGVAIDDQDPCVCIYTSGTTDMPKGGAQLPLRLGDHRPGLRPHRGHRGQRPGDDPQPLVPCQRPGLFHHGLALRRGLA